MRDRLTHHFNGLRFCRLRMTGRAKEWSARGLALLWHPGTARRPAITPTNVPYSVNGLGLRRRWAVLRVGPHGINNQALDLVVQLIAVIQIQALQQIETNAPDFRVTNEFW
jgi:hypothetical protein